MNIGWINAMPLLSLFLGLPLSLVKWLSMLAFPIISLMLQVDTEKLETIANVEDQLKEELAENGGKLPVESGGNS